VNRAATASFQYRGQAKVHVLTAIVVVLWLLFGDTRTSVAEDYVATALKVTDDFRADLEELAGWCDERNLAEQAEKTRGWVRPRDPTRLFVSVLPDEMGPPDPPEGASTDIVAWHKRFYQLRREQAGNCYALARKAVGAGQASLAFDLIISALREDPDHKSIRRMLGFQQYRGKWLTNYEKERARKGYVWHDRFGWLKRNHVSQYEEGKRLYEGRWISADEDARLHADIRNGWVVSTEHYNILTNHSIEEAVALGDKLEGLYRVWKQLFIRYYASESQVASLFEGRAARLQLPQHNVVFFRNRQEYVATLRPNSPNIGISLGIYIHGVTTISKKSAMYFFAGEDSDLPTLFHEATHQLFHESRKVSQMVGHGANFWVIEGVAMYFESLKQENGSHVLGGFDAERIEVARIRLFNPEYHFYEPLAAFCELNITDIQSDQERIAMRYTQAAGLFFFLMHYDNGRYRDAVVAYLNAVYGARDSVQTLSQLTGKSYEELDREYKEFMAEGNE
jgi:uncharacterized protein DUF1570